MANAPALACGQDLNIFRRRRAVEKRSCFEHYLPAGIKARGDVITFGIVDKRAHKLGIQEEIVVANGTSLQQKVIFADGGTPQNPV